MKIGKTICIITVLVSILSYIGAATPGISVTTDPQSIITEGNKIIDYNITITNLDNDYSKTISSLGLTIEQPSTDGWIYTFDPDLTGTIIEAGEGNYITTTLHVKVPGDLTFGNVYDHQVTAEAQYELFPGYFGSDSDPEDLNTIISSNIPPPPVPEAPTITLLSLGVFGLLLVMHRRK